MMPPDRKGRELGVLVLRTAGFSQEATSQMLEMAKRKVREIEEWFTNLSEDEAQLWCEDQWISRTVERLMEGDQPGQERLLQRVRTITSQAILEKYRRIAGIGTSESGTCQARPLQELASTYAAQLRNPLPPPDMILPPLDPGNYTLEVRETTLWILARGTGRSVRLSALAGNHGEAGETFHIRSSVDGLLSLVCPAEGNLDFGRLLAMLDDGTRQAVGSRPAVSTEYLSECRDVLSAVEEVARGDTGATLLDPLLQGLQQLARLGPGFPPGISPPDALLRPDYWERIYQLAVLSRLRGEDLRPDEGNYRVKKSRTDLISEELYLGDTLLGIGPGGAPQGWLARHRQAIGVWAESQEVSQLVRMYNSLREIHRQILQFLEKVVSSTSGETGAG